MNRLAVFDCGGNILVDSQANICLAVDDELLAGRADYIAARPSDIDREFAAEGLSDGVIHVVVGMEEGGRATLTAWIFRDRAAAFDPEPFDVE